MDSQSRQSRQNRRERKDSHVHTHNVTKWIKPETLTRESINRLQMKVIEIYCHKNCWTVSGKIWGDTDITLNNNGEYRAELKYNRLEPFKIGDCDWQTASVTLPDGRNFRIPSTPPGLEPGTS